MNRCLATIRHTDRKGEPVVTRCGGVLDFVGITRHRLYGWRRWMVCTSPYCGVYIATDAHGSVAVIQKAEPSRTIFPSRGLVSFDDLRTPEAS